MPPLLSCSCPMMWDYFSLDTNIHAQHSHASQAFIESVDAADNGVNPYDTPEPPKYLNNTTLGSRVSRLNPRYRWQECVYMSRVYVTARGKSVYVCMPRQVARVCIWHMCKSRHVARVCVCHVSVTCVCQGRWLDCVCVCMSCVCHKCIVFVQILNIMLSSCVLYLNHGTPLAGCVNKLASNLLYCVNLRSLK
jgi:hypothetical protein